MMELTGKNKERFEKWYSSDLNNFAHPVEGWVTTFAKFEKLPLSMQFGVVQDYADSIETLIEVTVVDDMNTWTYDILVKDIMGGFVSFVKGLPEYSTRDEARLAAIKAFDEIVNGN